MGNEKDPRLTGKRDGSSIAQTPIQLAVGKEHRGHRADANAFARTKKPKLRRRHFQQLINSILHRAERLHQTASVPADLVQGARRPDRKKA